MQQTKPVLWILPIEPLDTRYTAQWYDRLPKIFEARGFDVRQIDGVQTTSNVTPGAFLNFNDTMIWKSTQLATLLQHNIGDNDHILITDAWNPAVIQLSYIKRLTNKHWVLHGMWHAGAYDVNDFLGRATSGTHWAKSTEHSLYASFDYNYFATEYHEDLFLSNLQLGRNGRTAVVGWPMEYLAHELAPYQSVKKSNTIVFPHRIAPEKQLHVFEKLAAAMPQYNWVVCQNQKLTKAEYHTILAEAKIVFSASKQETLGISTCGEGPLLGALPLVPNSLSYAEIFADFREFTYSPEWVSSEANTNVDALATRIQYMMENYNVLQASLEQYVAHYYPKYFNSYRLVQTIRNAKG